MVGLGKIAGVFLFVQMIGFGSLPVHADCPSPDPQISFSISYGNVGKIYNDSAYHAPSGTHAVGHLEGNAPLRFRPVYTPLSGGCYYISQVNVEIIINATIKVSNQYPSGSCQQQVVARHEDRHLQVVKDFYNYVPANFTPVLSGMLRGRTGFQAGQQSSATQMLINMSQDLQSRITNEHKNMQYSYVDAPQLMQQEYAKCQSW